MTLLCLDAGNTRLKWGWRADGRWLAQGACATTAVETLVAALPGRPTRIVACNVAGDAVAGRIAALAAGLGAPLDWFRSGAAAHGVINGYADPVRLGDDRWAALIGARGLHAGHALVVMSGTATTIDILDATGRFAGGLILPGLALMRDALARNTAGLPEARGGFREIPTNTDDAIASGAVQATLGAIERMARRAAGTDFLCLLSGGDAPLLAPLLDLPLRQVDNLVLEGLARAAEK
ncbi:MAG: type III pantothenate kinase [Pseudomonadota bacterium]